MPTIVLYGPADIPFTRKVVAALALKGLEHQLVEPRGPEDYKRMSPENGLLPVIDVDGKRVQDSGRILDFLDEAFPQPPLLSSDPKVAGSQRRLETWVEETLTFYWVNTLRSLVDGAEEGPQRPELGQEFPSRLDDLANFLGSRPFFYAEAPSRADLAVWSFLKGIGRATGPSVEREVQQRGALRDHIQRVEEIVAKAAAAAPSGLEVQRS